MSHNTKSSTEASNPPAAKKPAYHSLTQEDVNRLLDSKAAVNARIEISGKLADGFDKTALSETEMEIAEQIFRILVIDTELEIRKNLSQKLKTNHALPRDIALTMANDVAEVALPILQYSKVLSNYDLIDIISATPDARKHEAIAKRETVPDVVVDALLENSEADSVAKALADNKGAELHAESIELMVRRFQGKPEVMDRLAKRENLPATVKEKIITYVSDQLKQQLSEKYNVAKEIVKEEASKSRKHATLELIKDDLNEEDMVKLVEQLITFKRLTPNLLVSAIAHGYINFYVVAMAVMAKIPIDNAVKLMRDKGGLGFRGLYNKCDLPAEHYIVLRDLTPHAIALKEERADLEGKVFATQLKKRCMAYLQSQNKKTDHLGPAIDATF